MHQPIFTLAQISIAPWQLIGFVGTCLFSIRWIVQLLASRKAGISVLPINFWYISAAGSMLLTIYFLFGIKDSVGFISNLFPLIIALSNIYLYLKQRDVSNKEDLVP